MTKIILHRKFGIRSFLIFLMVYLFSSILLSIEAESAAIPNAYLISFLFMAIIIVIVVYFYRIQIFLFEFNSDFVKVSAKARKNSKTVCLAEFPNNPPPNLAIGGVRGITSGTDLMITFFGALFKSPTIYVYNHEKVVHVASFDSSETLSSDEFKQIEELFMSKCRSQFDKTKSIELLQNSYFSPLECVTVQFDENSRMIKNENLKEKNLLSGPSLNLFRQVRGYHTSSPIVTDRIL